MLMLLFLAIPLLLYAAAALSVPKEAVKSPADYFTAFHRVSTVPFSNSSVAYAFQIATVYPFLTWAVAGTAFVPFLNAVAWGMGILLFSLFLPRLRTLFGTSMSLHGFLGTAYGSRLIQLTTSLLTLIGLLGVAVGEITWGSQAISAVVQGHAATYSLMAVMIFCVFIYIGFGGQASSFRTDQLQLVFSYIGVLCLCAVLFLRASAQHVAVSNLTRWSAVLAILYSAAVLLARRGRILVRTDSINSFATYTTNVANLLVVLLFIGVLIVSGMLLPPKLSPAPLLQLDGFGALGLASMVLLPLGFQFVDMTNWQRLISLQGDLTQEIRSVRYGLHLFALESPFTWIIFLMLGSAAVDVLPVLRNSSNVLAELPYRLLLTGNNIDYWAAVLFLISILAIMLSTVDSVLMAAMFTFMRDIMPILAPDSFAWLNSDPPARRALWRARIFGAMLLLAGVSSYIIIDFKGRAGELFIGALFTFYTAQLAMLPLVLGAMFLGTPPPGNMVLPGLILSVVVGIGLGLSATFARPGLVWWPVPVCLGMSFGLYGVALIIKKMRATQGPFKKVFGL